MSSVKETKILECREALKFCGIPAADLLVKYMVTLLEVNEKVNLTGAKTPKELALKHIADAFGAWNTVGGIKRPLFDVGSGGGLPGIVLAILSPAIPVFLVERRTKKAQALAHIVEEIGLDKRVTVFGGPFEQIKDRPYDAECWFRGFLPGVKLAQYFSENIPERSIGPITLMKGPLWPEEKQAVADAKGVTADWKERLLSSSEETYSLPHDAGARLLVLV